MKTIPVYVFTAFCILGMSSCGNMTEISDKQETASYSSQITSENKSDEQASISDLTYAVNNDMNIDGIPVCVPCTKDELLNSLGDKYSFDEVDNLLVGGKKTMSWVVTDYNDENIIKSIGFRYDDYDNKADNVIVSETEKGILSFNSVNGEQPYSMEDVLKAYTMPYKMTPHGDNNKFTRIQYYSGDNIDESEYVVQCEFSSYSNKIITIIVTYYGDDNELY